MTSRSALTQTLDSRWADNVLCLDCCHVGARHCQRPSMGGVLAVDRCLGGGDGHKLAECGCPARGIQMSTDGTRLGLVAVALALFSFSLAPAAVAEPTGDNRGAGTESCGKWTEIHTHRNHPLAGVDD